MASFFRFGSQVRPALVGPRSMVAVSRSGIRLTAGHSWSSGTGVAVGGGQPEQNWQTRLHSSTPTTRVEQVTASSTSSPHLPSSIPPPAHQSNEEKYGMKLPLLRAIVHAAQRIQKRQHFVDPAVIAKTLPASARMAVTLESNDGTLLGVAKEHPELFEVVEVEEKVLAPSIKQERDATHSESKSEVRVRRKAMLRVVAPSDFGLEAVVAKIDNEILSGPQKWHSMRRLLQSNIITEADLELIVATGYDHLSEFLLLSPGKFKLSADLEAFGGPQASGDPTLVHQAEVSSSHDGHNDEDFSDAQKPPLATQGGRGRKEQYQPGGLFTSGYSNLPAPLPVTGKFRSSPETGSLMRLNSRYISGRSGDLFKALQVLTTYLPSVYFVPLVVVEKTIPEDTLRSALDQVADGCASLQDLLMDMPTELCEVKVLGDQPTDIFIRLIGMDVPFSPHETADELYSQYFLSQSQALKLHAYLLGTAPGGPHQYATTSRERQMMIDIAPISLGSLEKVLPPKMFDALPLKGASAILLFLRMPHLFQVDIDRYEIQPRKVVGCDDDSGDLVEFTIENSPCPRTIRMIQRMNHPTSIEDLEPQLPAPLKLEIQNSVGELKNFVASHRLYCYIKEERDLGSVVWTRSMTMQKLEENRIKNNPSLPKPYEQRMRTRDMRKITNEIEVDSSGLMREVFHILPRDGTGVSMQMLLRRLSRRSADVLKSKSNSRQWFETMSDKIIVSHKVGTGYAKYILFRRETTPHLPANILGPCKDVLDVVKEVAMVSCQDDGQWIPTLVQYLSPECRELIRAMGGIDALLVSCSDWFCYVRGTTTASGWIRYIGHLKEAEKNVARELAQSVGIAENRSMWAGGKLLKKTEV